MICSPSSLRLALPAAAAILAASLAGCSNHLTVPLTFNPSTEPAEMQAKMQKVDLGGAVVSFQKLEDARKDKMDIGGQPNAKEPHTVSTPDDVGVFVARYLADSMSKLTPGSGLQVIDTNPKVIVTGQVLEFYATETGEYEGSVRLKLVVKKPDGTQLTEVTTQGKASRPAIIPFSGSLYMKVLSDAVLQIARSLVEDPGFRKALQGG